MLRVTYNTLYKNFLIIDFNVFFKNLEYEGHTPKFSFLNTQSKQIKILSEFLGLTSTKSLNISLSYIFLSIN